MKILILKPSSLGDVVHALPVLRLLKLHLPESDIFWWLESGLAPLLEGDPDLAGIIPFQRKSWAAPSRWPELCRGVSSLRRERFDWAIDLQGLARSGLFAWLSNAQFVIGLDNDREGRREGARLYYDALAPRSAPKTHAVDRYLAVLGPLGVPADREFKWLPERPDVAARIREKWPADSDRWIALLPGARWSNKRWPARHFVDLTRRLVSVDGVKVVVLGGKDDVELGREIAASSPGRCLDLTNRTSLWEMIEWIRRCELVITNDTGPMHVAAALRKPVIAMFGPTDPDGTGPYGQREHVLQTSGLPCAPCMKAVCQFQRPLACLEDIPPALVFARAMSRLEGASRVRT